MWLLVIMTVLSIEPTVRVIYDPVAKLESLEQCETMAKSIEKHNSESKIFCIRSR
jgi:hypothetical protein